MRTIWPVLWLLMSLPVLASAQPCAITDLAAGAQTPCDPATNTYTQEVIVTYENPPVSGTLDVNGQSFAIGTSPQTVTLVGLVSDGTPVDVTASFSADPACSRTEIALFTAPGPCFYQELVFDLHPTSCPNPLNVKSKGVTPEAVLGSAEFDVRDIDVSSLLLEGVPPKKFSYEDVAGAYDGELCGCTEDGPDVYEDLTLKFPTQAVVATLLPAFFGEEKALTLTGTLQDGTPFEASDCVVIRGAPKDAVAPAPGGETEDETPGPVENGLGLSSSGDGKVETITYGLPEASEVRLIVYSVTGRVVERLVQSSKPAGNHTIKWNASRHPSGIYFFRLEAGGSVATRKIVLIER